MKAKRFIEQNKNEIIELGRKHFETPELGYKEFETKKILVEYFNKHNIKLKKNILKPVFL